MNILVTGGAGYIGSHTIIELLASGHGVVVVDNLSNSSAESLHRVEEITGQAVPFHEFDLRDRARLAELFKSETIDAAIHFAGLKARRRVGGKGAALLSEQSGEHTDAAGCHAGI